MEEGLRQYTSEEIARRQLRTAVWLFLEKAEHSSAITLAGAAGNILEQLVRNKNEEPFTDYACRVHDAIYGSTPKRTSYRHHMDMLLGISAHKHMGRDCPDEIELDLTECAIRAITRAVSDYIQLYDEQEDFVKAFLNWSWQNQDGPGVMEQFRNQPEKLKKKLKK